MFSQPEFLSPNAQGLCNQSEQSVSLAEYLKKRISQVTENLCPVNQIIDLMPLVEQNHIVWLDLEINPRDESLIAGAIVVDNKYWGFEASIFSQQSADLYYLLEKSMFLGGHNIIDFDLPRLVKLLKNSIIDKNILHDFQTVNILHHWQAKSWDTLILSCLLIPHQPSHALAKLYKAEMDYNNPVLDCLESACIFRLCLQAWYHLPTSMQLLFHRLLPQLGHLGGACYFAVDKENILDIEDVLESLPSGNKVELKNLLKKTLKEARFHQFTQNFWEHLGLATFISWLRYFNKPQARRPVWIHKHTIYHQGFQLAEKTFWQLHQPEEEWINQQCYEIFGFSALRVGQMSIVKAILQNKDIPLGVLPTGGGKSLTFQLPALILSKYQRQLTIIISPLKALIEDQVINLHNQLPDYANRIAYLTSGQTADVQKSILTGVWQGDIDILYLSPERLRTHSIRQLLKNRPPALWVLDEAHTLSQWGTDFRPDFLRIAEHILACYQHELTNHFYSNGTDKQAIHDIESNSPRISLVTATASARVRDDLTTELVDKLSSLTNNKTLVQYGTPIHQLKIWRDDINTCFLEVEQEARKSRILQILQQRKDWYAKTYVHHAERGVAIVYLRNREGCEEYAKDFIQQGLKAVAYHAKLDESQKKFILEQFKNDALDVVVCTNAFGMGIDKEGIHTVIHSGLPNNLESYIQEIGRAARKSYETGEAYLLWSFNDIEKLFQQERFSRIPNTDTLRNCWQTIRPILRKPIEEQWFPSSALSPILDMNGDSEQLNTQIRVALLALERYGLLKEKEQQPAWISIKLLQSPPENQLNLLQLYQQLQQIDDTEQENLITTHFLATNERLTQYHLPELAAVLGYSVKSLLKQMRQLVNLGYAQWELVVKIRLKYKHQYLKGQFNKLSRIVDAMQHCIENHIDLLPQAELDNQGYVRLNTKNLDNWFVQNHYNINCKNHLLPMMQALNILKIRHHSRYQVFISASATTKQWLIDNDLSDNWSSWLKLAEQLIIALKPLFEEIILTQLPDNKEGISKDFSLDLLAQQLTLSPIIVLEYLEQLQNLDLIELSRLDDDANVIFFIGENYKLGEKNQRITRYSQAAYQYLQKHYEDRCMRIHVLSHWLQSEAKIQQALIEDYFNYPLTDVVEKYLDKSIDATKPYLKDYHKEIIPSFFSNTQQKIIQDTSRASMVLAGPGSGKTTVVVHRIAYLLMMQEIKPEKILVLAYNRLAVLELRERLKKLVGSYAQDVTIQTFHGLARQITGLNEKDAPIQALKEIIERVHYLNKEKNHQQRQENASYQWLIEQAIAHLQECPQHFQYIMVDEFQDVDEYQYQMIGLLADLQLQQQDIETLSDEIENKSIETDDFEQRGYLMVVGDDDQNLYAFRGASIQYIQQFAESYHIDNQKKFYLLNNYRSANNIVYLANRFIEQALPEAERLKDVHHQIKPQNIYQNQPIRYAFYQQTKGIDMASWLAIEINKKLAEIKADETIAVLAPQWDCFDAVQHYLELFNIKSQRYNENDQIIPLNSVIGQALYQYLAENRLQTITENVGEFLENWRKQQHFNHLDKAWSAIVHCVGTMQGVTHEQILQELERILYDDKSQVILITFHSAKGMEFDHVYVIDRLNHKQVNQQEYARPLYVALTRAKQTLTIFQHNSQHHAILTKILTEQAECIKLPTVKIPNYLSFHRFMYFDEIVLTPKALVQESGRRFVQQVFCKDSWGKTFQDVSGRFIINSINKNVGFYSLRGQIIAQFSKSFAKNHVNRCRKTQCLTMVSFTTTLFYQQDKSWYEKAGYQGTEQTHYLIIPYVKFKISCQ